MANLGTLLNIGTSALFTAQTALTVTGENIANVDTAGYSRRSVTVSEAITVESSAGEIGTGVNATNIIRNFDEFVELQYLQQLTMTERWETLYTRLSGVESLVNEADETGLSSLLSQFFVDWNDLTQSADSSALRSTLISDTDTLLSTLKQLDADLETLQGSVELQIQQDVARVNEILEEIAELNKQITTQGADGTEANSLLDQRSTLIRELDGFMDVTYIDNGAGNFMVMTESGKTLVDSTEHFSITYESAKAWSQLKSTSSFDGKVYFEGEDSYEYTVEIVTAGGVTTDSTAAQFRVSLDGGDTWLKDENGNDQLFYARPYSDKIEVGGLEIYFGSATDDTVAPTQNFTVGDKFTILPKSGLYWNSTTSGKENITPYSLSTGEDDPTRVTGGSLAALFGFRDEHVGSYREALDAFAEELIWEINRMHSQGAGLEKFQTVTGTYSVADQDIALGSGSSGLAFGSRLQSGSSMVHIYNTTTGLVISNASGPLDWGAAAGVQNFNPDIHTLASAAAAFNRTYGSYMTASVVDDKLLLQAQSGYSFAFGTDTTGLMAALGLNTYFDGEDAGTIQLNSTVANDHDFICAGHVNGAGEVNESDNTTALAIADLQDNKVTISTFGQGTATSTLTAYYNSIVGAVGTDVSMSSYNYQYSKSLSDDLADQQDSVAGVNLDEEMSNLIKYQHAYTAAAKLITAADEMIQTVLALKS